MNKQTESQLQIAVANYLRVRYPDALFHSDFGAGIHLTARQGAIQKRQQGGRRGHPDLVIYDKKGVYNGLAIELKKEGTRIFKRDGSPASDHIKEQADYLWQLQERDWLAVFCVGLDEAIAIIDSYFALKDDEAVLVGGKKL